jgi:Flp pilus assembly pilin Flp
MRKLVTKAHAWVATRQSEEDGAAFAEHGLLLVGIAAVVAIAAAALGTRVVVLYDVAF